MKMGEDARDIIIHITPLVLRASLEVVYVKENNWGQLEIQRQHSEAKNSDFFFKLEDSLNLHDTVLSVILKSSHYDIIYRKNWSNSLESCISRDVWLHQILAGYRKPEEKTPDRMRNSSPRFSRPLSQDRVLPSGQEVSTNGGGETIIIEACGHTFDKTSIRSHIEMNFINYFGKIWFEQKGQLMVPSCPTCHLRLESFELL